MDCQPTVREAVTLSSFVLVLVTYIRKKLKSGEHGEVFQSLPLCAERENHFRATLNGIDTIYITDKLGNTRPIRDVVKDIIELIAETAHEMGEGERLKQLEDILHKGPSYIRQRKIYEESGSLKEVSASMVRELEEDLERYRINPVSSS
jgi:carboxylate-amine ligase